MVVGIVEQNHESDDFCIESYCKAMGVDIYRRTNIRDDTIQVIATATKDDCPRIHQLRNLAVHHDNAKGPTYARSLVRKVLGDEEFCLQIDSHSEFVPEWDDKLRQEWWNTNNEFGIISAPPPPIGDKKDEVVPRQCRVDFDVAGYVVSK